RAARRCNRKASRAADLGVTLGSDFRLGVWEQRENRVAESKTADVSSDFVGVQQGGNDDRLIGACDFLRTNDGRTCQRLPSENGIAIHHSADLNVRETG